MQPETEVKPDSKQRTLLDLKKVVRLDNSAVCFSVGDVEGLKQTLLDPATPKYLLLTTLRKLDCFRIGVGDLVATGIGSAVATLTSHPKVEVAKLAFNVQRKWQAMIDSILFKSLPYNAELAATIPEEPPAPIPSPPEQDVQQTVDRQTQQELRRQQEIEFLLTDSDQENSSDSGDDDWRPGKSKRTAKRKQTQCRPKIERKQQVPTVKC